MKITRFARLLTAASLLFAISAPVAAVAGTEDLIVEHTSANGNYTTIQAAIDHANSIIASQPTISHSFTIRVKADTDNPYPGPITVTNPMTIFGDSTQDTTISGSGTLVTVNGVSGTGVTIRNFTFKSGSIGIAATGSVANITNNVFQLGSAATAVQLRSPSTTTVVNNTFYNNGTAIDTDTDIPITNDIFANNTKAIAAPGTSQLSYCDFFGNTNNIGTQTNTTTNLGSYSIPNSQQTNSNPLFVNAAASDFHLSAGSPCIGTGNPNYTNSFNSSSNMGAYGGPHSDIPTPDPVTGLTAALTPPSTVTLTWTATTDTTVKAYRVYFGTSSGNYNAAGSPLTVTTNSATLTDLPFTESAVPAAPTQFSVTSQDRSLLLSWQQVTGATGYRILYSTTGDANNQPTNPTVTDINVKDLSDATHPSYIIPGLVNGTSYFVEVEALAQPQYYFAVTSVVDSSIASAPDSVNESNYSTEISQGVGTLQISTSSPGLTDSPEVIVPYPNLKNEGCFIATAAYGFYSAPQVQVLRDFRDRYLLTNPPGRAFVAWYYHYGPLGAHFINVHPWLKPPVRLLLLPLVIGCYLLIHTSPLVKLAIVIFAVIGAAFPLRRTQSKIPARTGGTR